MESDYIFKVDETLNISQEVADQIEEAQFWQFIDRAMPAHLDGLQALLERETWLLEEPPSGGIIHSTSSRHTLTTLKGDPLEVALFTEMITWKPQTTHWRTSVMTGAALDEWLKQDVYASDKERHQ